ncbi:MAG: ATP-dependent Clp protease ATP-binding subunit [Candidatus Colwellbacteria bacterium]|nr:ATP-dependent Clp protease ATP-binding subunit [Candidatus Colwellbacteria bacterium]
MPKNETQFIFEEPLFELGYAGRLLVRVVSITWLVVLIVATLIFLLSDIGWLFWLGVLLLFYLIDRFFHLGAADVSFLEAGSKSSNLAHYLTPKTKRTLISVFDHTRLVGGDFSINLLKVLLGAGKVKEVLLRLEVPQAELESKLEAYTERLKKHKFPVPALLSQIENLILLAGLNRSPHQHSIETIDLFVSLGSSESAEVNSLFNLFNIKEGELARAAVFGRLHEQRLIHLPGKAFRKILSAYRRPRHRIMNRAWTALPTPLLDQFATDLTDAARSYKVGFLIGHDKELARLIDVLSRPDNPNAILIGDPGSGKETVVEHLAYLITKDRVPSELFDKRLVALRLGSLFAGADQAEIQNRVERVFGEIIRSGNIILYLPEIDNLARSAPKGQATIASLLLPLIANNIFPIIGTAFPREYKLYIEPDTFFTEAFELVRVEEVSPEEAELILTYRSYLLEETHKVRTTYGAIKKSVELAQKYFREKLLPASADDLLKEAATSVKNRGERTVTSDDVIKVAESRVNVPIREVEAGEAERLLNLEALIHERLINQEEAVKAVADSLRAYRSGLTRAGGPIGAFLFVGPTGVGKTELAKTLARIQFGQEEAMIRFDMSEFQDAQSLYRFIGAPDGETRGRLTEAVLEKPFSLILLDEFEKAHPDIWNVFLQVFDDGRLTDNLGRVVNFENTIIIATSNAHSDVIHSSLRKGESMESISEYLKQILVDVFRPELLNRFSDIIVFRNLEPVHLREIVKLQLKELGRLLDETQGIKLEYTDAAVELLARLGYEPAFGARPLRRVIEDKIKAPLSEKIIARGSLIKLDVVGSAFVITPQ